MISSRVKLYMLDKSKRYGELLSRPEMAYFNVELPGGIVKKNVSFQRVGVDEYMEIPKMKSEEKDVPKD